MAHPAQWLHDGLYGLMVHYLVSPQGATPTACTAELNRTVDNFDLDRFMAQFDRCGADWLIFTLGQNTGCYCSPNDFLDAALPGRTSRRDLALEIAQRVKESGKKMILYLPAEVAGQSAEIKNAFGWKDGDVAQSAFHDSYLKFVEVYSVKFGDRNDGWWFDGCFEQFHHGRWDWMRWLAAAKRGNPSAIVALNDGAFCVGNIKPLTPLEDYHAGEIHLLEDGRIRTDFVGEGATMTPDGKVRDKTATFYMPDGRFIDGVQWHALLPLDCSFNPHVPTMSYADDELFVWAAACKKVGGAVTINVPIDTADGWIPEKSLAQLARLADFLTVD